MLRVLCCVVFAFVGYVNGLPLEKVGLNSETSKLDFHTSPLETDGVTDKAATQVEIEKNVLDTIWSEDVESQPGYFSIIMNNEHGVSDETGNESKIKGSVNLLPSLTPTPKSMVNTETALESNNTETNVTLDDKFLPELVIEKSWNSNVEEASILPTSHKIQTSLEPEQKQHKTSKREHMEPTQDATTTNEDNTKSIDHVPFGEEHLKPRNLSGKENVSTTTEKGTTPKTDHNASCKHVRSSFLVILLVSLCLLA